MVFERLNDQYCHYIMLTNEKLVSGLLIGIHGKIIYLGFMYLFEIG
jgi:hypothetical protein